MAYRFRHRETVRQNVTRIASEQLDAAIARLAGKRGGADRDDPAHAARKSIKKVRALLRMVRPDLGSAFRQENLRLRDIGRRLSELRNAGALVQTVDNLRREKPGGALRKSLRHARQVFAARQRQKQHEAAAQKLFREVAAELRAARRSIRERPIEDEGFPAISAGMERTFRDGRKALAKARASGRIEDYHEWRKRVKDHWYHMRLLKNVWGDVIAGYAQSLQNLEHVLGEDINLALLESRVKQSPPEDGAHSSAAALRRAVKSARRGLRRQALEIGARVYAEKPRAFIRQLRKLWKVW